MRRVIARAFTVLADASGRNRKAHPLNTLHVVGDGPWRVLHDDVAELVDAAALHAAGCPHAGSNPVVVNFSKKRVRLP
jgi:hypothetical protein